jgi:hypothetical protein
MTLEEHTMEVRNVNDRYVADIWKIARESWIRARFDPARALHLSESAVSEKFGSVIGALQLIAVIMQILYMLYQWFQDSQVRRPSLEFNDLARAFLLRSGYAFKAEVL